MALEKEKTIEYRINPFVRTKISNGYCSIYSRVNSVLIILENAEGEVILETYANKITYVNYTKPIYAKSAYGMLNISVRDVSNNIIVDKDTGYEDIKNVIDDAVSKAHTDTNFEAYYILTKG